MEWRKKNLNLTSNSFFENSKFAIFYLRKPFLFCMLEKFRSVFNENIDKFLTRKISEKTFRFEFNENTYLFLIFFIYLSFGD